MPSVSRVIALAIPLLSLACGATTTTTPRIRVARDLGCTAEQTAVQRLSEHRWQVTGCGRTAVYHCTSPVVRDCWREGEIRSEGALVSEAGQPQGPAPVSAPLP